MTFDWQPFFPFSEPRKEQVRAIDFALDAFLNKDKKFVCLDLSTGIGKSPIGIAIGRYLLSQKYNNPSYEKGFYILTTQKTLQEQYIDDFGRLKGSLKTIKSSTNYGCSRFDKNCGEIQTILKKDKNFHPCKQDCIYKHAKKEFLSSPEGTTNFPYFMLSANFNPQFKPRELMIVDEAHNIENNLTSFVEISITDRFAKKFLKMEMPKIKSEKFALDWVENEYYPALIQHIDKLDILIERNANIKAKLDEISNFAKQFDLVKKHKDKVKKFIELYSEDNWAMTVENVKGTRKLEFKPIDIAPYTNDYLFRLGERVLLMSATILNKEAFCRSVGINKRNCEILSIPSPFPKENRPVFFLPCGKMSKDSIDKTLPKMADIIKDLLQQHKNDKGIIHTVSYKITEYIKNNVPSDRLLIPTPQNKEQVLQEHYDSDKPTVLVSPAMSEGVDLKGDRSRFQIICKVPYPSLGDKVVEKRIKKDKFWYPYTTAKAIIQSLGRSIRSETDYSNTYILDLCFQDFWERNKNMFPLDFEELLK